jgi:hypothetical protein
VQRDYFLTLPLWKLSNGQALPYGFSVLGDGVFYWLARTRFVSATGTLAETVLSRRYDMCNTVDARALFRLCVAMTRQAYARQHTYVVRASPVPDVVDTRFAFVEALDCNEASILFRFRQSTAAGVAAAAVGSAGRICKLPRNSKDKARFESECRIWREYHALLTQSECFVQLTATDFFGVQDALVFVDDGGSSLERVCRCTQAVRVDLLRAVHHDVSSALALLHNAQLAFVDLHPGNVIICTDAVTGNKRAKLIDCESVRAFGASLSGVPMRPRFASLDKTTASKESDWESFVYLLAWVVDEFCPTMREDIAHQATFNTRKKELCGKWPTPQSLTDSFE